MRVNAGISTISVDLSDQPEIVYDGNAAATGDGDNLN
jgi:hypothetical protein